MQWKRFNFGKIFKIIVIAMVVFFWMENSPIFAVNDSNTTSEVNAECKDGLIKDGQRCYSMGDSNITPGKSETIEDYAKSIIKYMAGTISVFAILGIMVGGVILMTAYGKEEQLQKGKSIIWYSILGLVFTIWAYIIVTFVQAIIYNIDTYK